MEARVMDRTMTVGVRRPAGSGYLVRRERLRIVGLDWRTDPPIQVEIYRSWGGGFYFAEVLTFESPALTSVDAALQWAIGEVAAWRDSVVDNNARTFA